MKMLFGIYTSKFGKLLRPLMIGGFLNKLTGFYCDLPISKMHIKSFIEKHKINMGEFIVPKNGYKTFNQFFIKKLKPGARPIAGECTDIVSPCDGYVTAIENISDVDKFFIKGGGFVLKEFIGEKLAAVYENGTMLILRLTPRDYHRFHCPFDGVPSKASIINGTYDSVHPVAYKAGKQPLTSNERHLIMFETEDYENIAIVPVGALCVGRIVETYTHDVKCNKGDELGYFSFGGSTIVLLFKKNVASLRKDLVENSFKSIETKIRMGEVIAFDILPALKDGDSQVKLSGY